jgi:hypothetical protein
MTQAPPTSRTLRLLVRVRREAREQVDHITHADHQQQRGQRLRHRVLGPTDPGHRPEGPQDADADRGERGDSDRERAEQREQHASHQHHHQRDEACRVGLELAPGHHELDRSTDAVKAVAARLVRSEGRIEGRIGRDLIVAVRRCDVDHERAHASLGAHELAGPWRILECPLHQGRAIGGELAGRHELPRLDAVVAVWHEQRGRPQALHAPDRRLARERFADLRTHSQRIGIESALAALGLATVVHRGQGEAPAEAVQ